MELKPREGLFSPGFKAFSVKNSGKKREEPVDPDSFYTGFLNGKYHDQLSMALRWGMCCPNGS